MGAGVVPICLFIHACAYICGWARRRIWASTVAAYHSAIHHYPRPTTQALFEAQRNYVAVTTALRVQAIAVNFAFELTGGKRMFEKVPHMCVH